jgi:hypothetical protein
MMLGFIYGFVTAYLLALVLMINSIENAVDRAQIEPENELGATLFVLMWPWEALIVIFHKLTGRSNNDQ